MEPSQASKGRPVADLTDDELILEYRSRRFQRRKVSQTFLRELPSEPRDKELAEALGFRRLWRAVAIADSPTETTQEQLRKMLDGLSAATAMARRYFYCCPSCGCRTDEMMPLDNSYTPTEADLLVRNYMAHIGHERLTCPCGAILTWFSVLEVEE